MEKALLIFNCFWIVFGLSACSTTTAISTPTVASRTTATATVAATPTKVIPTSTATMVIAQEENCSEEAVDYVMETEGVWESWQAVFDFPGMSPTIQDIRDSIPRLSAIREEAARIEPPSCANYIHIYLLDYMDKFIAIWQSNVNGDPDVVVNYKARELDEIFQQFEVGFLALQTGLELSLYPTPTPRPVVAGPEDVPITLPVTLTILALDDTPDVDVRDSAGGNRLSCRLDNGTEVSVIEASWDRAFLRVEGTDCDGWVQSSKLIP